MDTQKALDALLRMRAAIVAPAESASSQDRVDEEDLESTWGPTLDSIARMGPVQKAALWVRCLDALERRPPPRDRRTVYTGSDAQWMDACRRQLWCLFQCATSPTDERLKPYMVGYCGGGGGGPTSTTVHVHGSSAKADSKHGPAEEEAAGWEKEEETYEFERNSRSVPKYSEDPDLADPNNRVLTADVDASNPDDWFVLELDGRYGPEFASEQKANLLPMLNFLCSLAALEKGHKTPIAKLLPDNVNPSTPIANPDWFYRQDSSDVVRVNPVIVQCLFRLGPSNEGVIQQIGSRTYMALEKDKKISATLFYLLYLVHMRTIRAKLVATFGLSESSTYILNLDQALGEFPDWPICPENVSVEHFASTFPVNVRLFSWFILNVIGSLGARFRQTSIKREHEGKHNARGDLRRPPR